GYHAVDQPNSDSRPRTQGSQPRFVARRQKAVAQFKARCTGNGNCRQLKTAVADDEGKKRVGVADLGQVAGDGTKQEAVVHQEKNTTDSPGKPQRKGSEGNTDIVVDIKTEHLPIGFRVASAA